MNGRTTAALAALTMMIAGLAGCLSPSELLNSNEVKTEISALENRDLAENAAKAWDPNAKTLGVFSVELSDASDQTFPMDAAPGNGKAPAWIYAFADGKGESSRAFRVTADGRVVSENDSYDPSSMADQELTPLTNWKIDSTTALDAAAQDSNFSTALRGANVTLAEGVAEMEGVTAWYFAAISKAGSSIAIVDAATGSLIAVHPFSMDVKMPTVGSSAFSRAQPVHVEGEGTLDSAKPKMEFPFEATPGDLHLKLSTSRNIPGDGLTWTILDPEGEKVKSGRVSGFDAQGWAATKSTIELEETGAYTFVVTYSSFVPLQDLGGVTFKFALDQHMGEEEHDESH